MTAPLCMPDGAIKPPLLSSAAHSAARALYRLVEQEPHLRRCGRNNGRISAVRHHGSNADRGASARRAQTRHGQRATLAPWPGCSHAPTSMAALPPAGQADGPMPGGVQHSLGGAQALFQADLRGSTLGLPVSDRPRRQRTSANVALTRKAKLLLSLAALASHNKGAPVGRCVTAQLRLSAGAVQSVDNCGAGR